VSDLPSFAVPEYPVRRPTLVGEEMEGLDEIIYVDSDSGSSISLNTVGAAVLELCDGHHALSDIVAIILETIGGNEEQVSRDVRDILQEFAAYGLFEE